MLSRSFVSVVAGMDHVRIVLYTSSHHIEISSRLIFKGSHAPMSFRPIVIFT